MTKLKNKSQILMVSVLAALVLITPLLSPSLRPKYLYFLINLLVIALGAEAGLIFSTNPKPFHPPSPVNAASGRTDQSCLRAVCVPNEKNIVEKVMKKCASTPSLFFIGSEDVEHKEEDQQLEEISGQELFTKAEMFIGNFYKQLKMQREHSWKRIHGFYHYHNDL